MLLNETDTSSDTLHYRVLERDVRFLLGLADLKSCASNIRTLST